MACYTLRRWRIVEVDGGGRHLVGYAENEREGYAGGRVSSAIRSLTVTAVTRSGNRYELIGPGGRDPEADFVLFHWLRHNRAELLDDDCAPEPSEPGRPS